MTHASLVLAVLLDGGNVPSPPQWYEQVSGILAIPVTIIGVAYSYVLIKKTRLEATKTELEIREKQIALEKEQPSPVPSAAAVSSSHAFSFAIGSLLLRYVLLQLILSLSGIVRQPLNYLFKGLGYGVFFCLGKVMPGNNIGEAIGWGIVQLGGVADTILYWIIFFLLGWPLFKDILVFFGVSSRGMRARDLFKAMQDWRGFTKKLRDGNSD
jgi:hypothetical protein